MATRVDPAGDTTLYRIIVSNEPDINNELLYRVKSFHEELDLTRMAICPVDLDVASEGVAMSIVAAVADITDQDPATIRPLSTVVDPEALGALFAPTREGSRRGDGRVTFRWEGCTVTVYADERFEVWGPEATG